MAKLIHVVPECSFACQHVGMQKQLKARGINFKNLNVGDVVACVNRAETMLRVMVVLPEEDSFGFLGSYKSPSGRVPPEAIFFIPQALGSSGFDMNKAVKLGLEKILGET